MLVTLLLSSCVPLDQLPPGAVPGATTGGGESAAQTFPDLDPGSTSITSLHFTTRGYTEYDIRPISVMAENLYNKIGGDTGLYAFLASGSYQLIVYRDRDEYLQKTHLPQWSRAAAVKGAIYMYPGQDLEPVLAHEMTHLIFNAYMGETARSYRWLNEGIAMVEEVSKMADIDRAAFQSNKTTQLRPNKIPFSQMTFFSPISEEARRVDLWYLQVESVVSFMIAQGGALKFASMLDVLRKGGDLNQAINDNYPGKFHSLPDVENAWKFTV